jgi:predicted RNase H-like nuclease (RuvC/YqgF family)
MTGDELLLVGCSKHGKWNGYACIGCLEKEVEEQARLLGMSGEREADLLGKIERLERENAALTAKVLQLQDEILEDHFNSSPL